MGKLSSIPFFVVSMCMIHRRLPNIELLTHFIVRLENGLNSMPPSMVTSPFLLDKCNILGIIEIVKCPTKQCFIWIGYIDKLMAQFFFLRILSSGTHCDFSLALRPLPVGSLKL
jgi:hypothetical protein